MRLKIASQNEVERIGELILKWGGEMTYKVSLQEVVDDLERTMENGRVFYVESDEGDIIGMMSGNIQWHYWVHEKIAHEHFFFVDPRFRKQGLGRLLTQAFCEWAKFMKCGSVIIYPNKFGSVVPDVIKTGLEKIGFQLHGYSMRRVIDV